MKCMSQGEWTIVWNQAYLECLMKVEEVNDNLWAQIMEGRKCKKNLNLLRKREVEKSQIPESEIGDK